MRKENLGRVALIVTTLIWGTSFVVLKNTLDFVSTLYILAFRFTGAAIIMLIIGLKDIKKLNIRYLSGGIIMGLLLFVAYIFQTYGLFYTTPGKNAFITAVYVVLVPFFYWFFTKKRPDKYNIIAAFICIVGVGFVSIDRHFNVNTGDMLTLVGSIFLAAHIIATSYYASNSSIILLTMLQMAVAGVLSWLAALIFEPIPTDIPINSVFSIAYISILCTGVCYLLQTFGQKHTPPTSASILLSLESVFGVLMSVLFYGETFTIKLICGFLLIFVAVIISETKLYFIPRQKEKNNSYDSR